MEKRKYLVPCDMPVGQFIFILRSRLHLSPGTALFVFVRNTLPQTVDDPEKKASAASGRLQLPSSSSLREALASTSSLSLREQHHDEEAELKWAAIERLPTWDRLHTSLPLNADGARPPEPVDVRRLGAADRRELVHTLIADIHKDNLRLLRHQRRRMDRVGVRQPTVEVRWRNLRVQAECQVVDGKPLPTLLNSAVSTFSLLTTMLGFNRNQERIHILKDVTGILKPSRLFVDWFSCCCDCIHFTTAAVYTVRYIFVGFGFWSLLPYVF
ncbi:unnamed protein product [Triticum turgidum subsp. durum]|uniref:Pleiotropic ABC efflux transporter N-terminal domain-containing protein n=1 Tax=Triticum turgidum subsp. durum TaxID=4567 RepID=A0A9R0TMP8_TRITD|nr:unnamed protein product [Triticum turgidum subsp. durum]